MDEKLCTCCKRSLPLTMFGPCKRGPLGLFSWCKECARKKAAERRRNNPERCKAINLASKERNRDAFNARRRASRAANQEKTKAQRKADYAKYREKELETMRKWKEANRDHMRAQQAERYWSDPDAARKRQMDYLRAHPGKATSWRMNRIAQKLAATPPWANKDAIEAIYKRAAVLSRVTSIPHEVDHIVPLRSKHVNGLHCETNLQILTRAANRKKSNHFNTALAA